MNSKVKKNRMGSLAIACDSHVIVSEAGIVVS